VYLKIKYVQFKTEGVLYLEIFGVDKLLNFYGDEEGAPLPPAGVAPLRIRSQRRCSTVTAPLLILLSLSLDTTSIDARALFLLRCFLVHVLGPYETCVSLFRMFTTIVQGGIQEKIGLGQKHSYRPVILT
jgi:hypothetical protein